MTWHEREVPAMGSTARVVLHGPRRAADHAVARLADLEAKWSRFRADSDVARLNRAAGDDPVPVAAETLDLLGRAVWLARVTAGRFDPTILRALEACGYDDTFSVVRARDDDVDRMLVATPPGHAPLRFAVRTSTNAPHPGARPAPGVAGIAIDRSASTAALPCGVAVDLGGVGKGYAADLVTAEVMALGATATCVGVGGDVACAGAGPLGGWWDVEVEDPFVDDRAWIVVRLTDAAVVTSTRRVRRWRHRGRWQHHIIDPQTGAPSTSDVAAVVAVDRCAWRAEGLAKAALVAGSRDGRALLERFAVPAWLVDGEQRVHEAAGVATLDCRAAA